ncbi:hypothetical protein AB4306_18470 [Vibrio splendidus]|uniref:hypothetical protein n=1 Tax=Vibrio splendidus TaxID=29497 RepID=UPI00076AE3AB|nr:hypothetical protein [Vibrio splendidus]PHX05472.1 hypothetical protein VSPL_28660 [Vibrio splendidus]
MVKNVAFILLYVLGLVMFIKSMFDFSKMAWALHVQFEHDVFGVLMLVFCFVAYLLVAVVGVYLFLTRKKG